MISIVNKLMNSILISNRLRIWSHLFYLFIYFQPIFIIKWYFIQQNCRRWNCLWYWMRSLCNSNCIIKIGYTSCARAISFAQYSASHMMGCIHMFDDCLDNQETVSFSRHERFLLNVWVYGGVRITWNSVRLYSFNLRSLQTINRASRKLAWEFEQVSLEAELWFERLVYRMVCGLIWELMGKVKPFELPCTFIWPKSERGVNSLPFLLHLCTPETFNGAWRTLSQSSDQFLFASCQSNHKYDPSQEQNCRKQQIVFMMQRTFCQIDFLEYLYFLFYIFAVVN